MRKTTMGSPEDLTRLHEEDDALDLLVDLYSLGIGVRRLVEACIENEGLRAPLLVSLCSLCSDTLEWGPFSKTLHELAPQFMNEYTQDQELIIFRLLVKTMTHPGRLSLETLGPDFYWALRIRWYIATRDYRRAWGELKKARKQDEAPKPRSVILEELLVEMYGAMQEENLIPGSQPYDTIPMGIHKIKAYRSTPQIPAVAERALTIYFRSLERRARQKRQRRKLLERLEGR